MLRTTVVFACGVMLASCSSGRPEVIGEPSTATTGRTAVVRSGRWSLLTPPSFIADRQQTVAIPIDDRRGVVFGGERIDGRSVRVFADGATVDFATGAWNPLPPAPGVALAHLAGGVSGSHLLFAGTECKGVAIPKGDYPDGPASPPCPMDTVGLRRYDRVTKNWDVVTSVPGSLLGDATSVAVVAETGSTIVVVAFHVVGSHEVGVALQYDAVAQRWAAVPEPRQPIGRSC